MLLGVPEDEVPDSAVRTVGAVQMALISGVLIQRLADPEHARPRPTCSPASAACSPCPSSVLSAG